MTTLTLIDDIEAHQQLERRLLLLVGAFLFINFLALALLDAAPMIHWVHFAAWMIGAGGGTLALNRYLPYRDPLIFPLVMFLSGWGLVIIDRLAPNFADRQTVWLLVSVIALLVTVWLPHLLRVLRAFRYTLLVMGLGLLVSTILLGRNPSGAGPALWLGIGDLFFQPSEALKIILVIFLASYLGEQYPLLRPTDGGQRFSERYLWLSPRLLGPIILMWGVSSVVLVWQRDLGTAVVFFGVFLTLLYIASGQTLILLSGAVLMLAAAVVAYFRFDVVQLRIDIWLNPWLEADGRAYQIVQSLMAFGAGSIFGQGVGQGTPDYIPVIHSDFVFSALAEEWGLLGALVVIACIALLVMRGMRLGVMHHERPYYALLATGLSTLLGVQSLLIMGGVLKLMPLTGVTLPFLSYGGSSLLMCFVLAGLLLRLSAEIRE